jgi:hypothetical protein
MWKEKLFNDCMILFWFVVSIFFTKFYTVSMDKNPEMTKNPDLEFDPQRY